MTDWTGGYVTDVDYITGFYRELAPVWIDLVLVVRGLTVPGFESVHARSAARGYTYCELGCGTGLSVTLLAAANPQARFFANDFNPAHVASARRLAQRAGLTNITFLDLSFEEMLRADLPELDYIAFHGVYSWVSDDNRRHIRDFVRARLAPGGVVYCGYNSLPGWSFTQPLRKLLTDCAALEQAPTTARMGPALELAQRLAELDNGYFAVNPGARLALKEICDESRRYVAHEYFNRDWKPQYFSEVAAELAEAKLVFATSADVGDQIERPGGDEGEKLLSGISDPTFRETVRDFMGNTRFRRDLFMKGLSRMSILEQRSLVPALRFGVSRTGRPLDEDRQIGRQVVSLKPEIYGPILAALADGPKSFEEIAALDALAPFGARLDAVVFQALVVLTATNDAFPCVSPPAADAARETTSRLNEVLLEEAESRDRCRALASPVAGTGVDVTWIEQLFLGAIARGREPVAHAARVLKLHDRRVDGPADSEADTLRLLGDMHEAFIAQRAPALKALGVA